MTDSVAIIGLGASGLMAASLLGMEAFVLEKNDTAGKKLILTGGGKCNYTHDAEPDELLEAYYDRRNFVRPALYAFPPRKIRSYFQSLGIDSVTFENGKVFPKSLKATDIRDTLERKAGRIFYGQKVCRIAKKDGVFHIFTSERTFKAGHVIMATGGFTYRETGSEGDGYFLLENLGHTIVPPRPALGQLFLEGHPLKEAAGITIPVTIRKGRNRISSSAVITEKGLSGPAAEDFSRFMDGKETIGITFLDIGKETIKRKSGKAMLKNALDLPERLTEALLGELSYKRIADLTAGELEKICRTLSDYEVPASVPTLSAMGTTGGISTSEIDSRTMESRKVENLYITGELADVDAKCGGYSLTWAFASAYLAAQSIARNRKE